MTCRSDSKQPLKMIAFGGVVTALLAASQAAAEQAPSENCMQLADGEARDACLRQAIFAAVGQASGDVSSVVFADGQDSEVESDQIPNRALLRERCAFLASCCSVLAHQSVEHRNSNY